MPELSRRRFIQLAAGVGAVSAVPALRGAALGHGPGRGDWLAGDFHVHTTYSHDVWGGPGDDNTGFDEGYTLGWTPAEQIRIAETRGLHFVALTDHDRIDGLFDPGYRSDRLLLVPGYEHSLGGDHLGLFVPDRADLRPILAAGDAPGFAGLVGMVHEAGGMCVVNHPGSEGWGVDLATTRASDAIEVWNSHWVSRADTTGRVFESVQANNHRSMAWWEANFLGGEHGWRKAAVGGSDNHWRSTTAVQGVGQPTTWVYARNRTPSAVIEAVQAGRTFVSAQAPAFGGARLFLEVAEDWRNGQAAMVGGTVRGLGPLVATLRVENGAGHVLRLIATGRQVYDTVVSSPVATFDVPVVLAPGGWLRAELYADPGYAMAAVTSPVYADPVEVAPDFARAEPTPGPPVSYETGIAVPAHLHQERSCC